MTKKESDNLLINIQNTAATLASVKGSSYVTNYLQLRYGVKYPEELSPCDYDQVFDDLDYMANDP